MSSARQHASAQATARTDRRNSPFPSTCRTASLSTKAKAAGSVPIICAVSTREIVHRLILTLIGDDYIYRADFYHESKNEPHVEEQLVAALYDLISKYKVDIFELLIYVSKSPCFHQDCDPRCEVVDECRCNKACAKLLGKTCAHSHFHSKTPLSGLLLCKVRKELSKVDIKMTVKFLYPHLNRGDLYTKQGILCMLQSGIKVEPLLMKDWSAIMDWSPHVEHKGEYLQVCINNALFNSTIEYVSGVEQSQSRQGGRAIAIVHQRVSPCARPQHEVLGGGDT